MAASGNSNASAVGVDSGEFGASDVTGEGGAMAGSAYGMEMGNGYY